MNIGLTQTTMARAIVNVSNRKYWRGQDRLVETLKGKTDTQVLAYRFESEVGAKKHSESMYGFKPLAIEKAYNLGYRQILWLDASMYVLRDLDPIFKQIEQDGYYFQNSGWLNDRWTTPEAEEYFGTNKGKMISSGVLGLDLNNKDASDFLYLWLLAMKDGMFNGSHDNYRHDQSAASLIIENMGLKITENNTHWTYGSPEQEYPENILIIAHGIV